jgi:carbon dioxide concentrating mechanism protein CcmO
MGLQTRPGRLWKAILHKKTAWCRVKQALGLIEVHSWSGSMAVLDRMEKAAGVELLQVEINDLYGACIKVTGSPADLDAALAAGRAVAEAMKIGCVAQIINAPDERARPAYEARAEFSPLIEANLVHFPSGTVPVFASRKRDCPLSSPTNAKEPKMTDEAPFAIGMIETQGLTAVFEAIDTACKAANVEVIGREKLGGGYITVLIKGDVAAVKAAVEAGVAKVEGLGKLIAGHVIPRPSKAVLSLLPKP